MKRDLRDFLNSIENEVKKDGCKTLVKVMEQESGISQFCTGRSLGSICTITNMLVAGKGMRLLLGFLRDPRISLST